VFKFIDNPGQCLRWEYIALGHESGLDELLSYTEERAINYYMAWLAHTFGTERS